LGGIVSLFALWFVGGEEAVGRVFRRRVFDFSADDFDFSEFR